MRKAGFVVLVLFLATLAFPFQSQAQPKKFEVTLFGGLAMPTGSWTAKEQPGDLFTGTWSPFFGYGYEYFFWSSPVGNLDPVIGEPAVNQSSGLLTGVKLDFSLSPRFQLGLTFGYALTKFRFTDEAGQAISDVLPEMATHLQNVGRTVQSSDDTVQSKGSMILLLANGCFNLIPEGRFIPYISLGAGVALHSGAPSFSYTLSQASVGTASYGLDVTYTTKTSFALSFGLGAKVHMGKGFGFKVEANGIFSPVSLDQEMTTTFSRTTLNWFPYDDFAGTACTQDSSRIILNITAGFFFSF